MANILLVYKFFVFLDIFYVIYWLGENQCQQNIWLLMFFCSFFSALLLKCKAFVWEYGTFLKAKTSVSLCFLMFSEPRTTSCMRTPCCCPSDKELLWFIKKKSTTLKTPHSNRYLYFCTLFKIRWKPLKISLVYYRVYATASTKCVFVWVQSVSAPRKVSYSKGCFGTHMPKMGFIPFWFCNPSSPSSFHIF